MDGIKIISRDLGSVLIIVGIIYTFTISIPIIFNEYYAILWLLLTSGVFVALGMFLRLMGRKAEETKLRHAVATAGLSWIFIPLLSVIPFMFISNLDFLSAFFESMSGWTTTGLTMLGGSEAGLSHTIQFLRTFSQWIGGIGVVVLTVTILARPGSGSYSLYRSEAREEKIHPSIISTIRSMWWMFLLYTVVGIVLLSVFGMPIWDAINHSMCAISTGGFSVEGASIGAYNSAYIEIIIIIIMALGAIAFIAHHKLLTGNIRKFLKDIQFRALIFLIILGGGVLTFLNLSYYDGSWLTSFQYSFFQFASAQTTTGFASTDISSWIPASKLILSFGMIIGGAAGATCGGIKLFRIILLAKETGWMTKKIGSTPRRVSSYKLAGKNISSEEKSEIVNEAAIIAVLWVICLIIGIFVLLATTSGYSLDDIIFEVCSAQGNVGLSMGITHVAMNPLSKIMLIISMYIGRLEIIPILMMVRTMLRR
ncbi:MAG: TrkH family potassium uptake protein [Candidatus Thermoplasmatota archaeon]|nr:TrkH family potassium uptake protein [Candidatus Thermoplasmatota archaeon]